MKKPILAALALLTLASCAKESSTTEQIDPTAPVAATFTSAAITRVADNAWVVEDKIGITMVATAKYDLADGDYENVSYTVDANATGTFTPTAVEEGDPVTIYFPVDGTEVVDFIAYYPKSDIDGDKNIAVSVADQSYEHIDLVAAKAVGKSKSSSSVAFTDSEAFSHQLSKLTMTIIAGDGVGSLDGMVTTIKGQNTTAEFNIYSFEISGEGNVADITAVTTADGSTVSAILIPTEKVSGSTIEFKTTDGNVYILDTSEIVFTQGKENTYEITLNRTGATITSSTINGWGTGENGSLDATEYTVAASAVTLVSVLGSDLDIYVYWSFPADATSIAGVKIYYSTTSGADLSTCEYVDIHGTTITSYLLDSTNYGINVGTTYYITLATYNSAGDETYYPTEKSAAAGILDV